MSEADDRLREASDPTTPGERLRALYHEDHRGLDLALAVLGNPSVPLDLLGALLRRGRPGPGQTVRLLVAWHNPAVALLLLSEPQPEYPEAAARLLGDLGRLAGSRLAADASLADAIGAWARSPRPAVGVRQQGRALARRLADLFDLPWPGP